MRLLGARPFLKTVKPGTLFIEFWFSDESECQKLIDNFKSGMSINDILEQQYGSYHIYGDNSGSLAFIESLFDEEKEIVTIDDNDYDFLFYYDKNIVGDANPSTTLNIVFDSPEEWPNEVPVTPAGEEDNYRYLEPDDLERIIKWFLEECGPFRDEVNDKSAWALKALDEKYYKDKWVVDCEVSRL